MEIHSHFQMNRDPEENNLQRSTKELSQALGNVTIVKKGPEDIISDGKHGLYPIIIVAEAVLSSS